MKLPVVMKLALSLLLSFSPGQSNVAARAQLFLVDDYKMAAHKVLSLIYSRSKAEEEVRCCCELEVR